MCYFTSIIQPFPVVNYSHRLMSSFVNSAFTWTIIRTSRNHAYFSVSAYNNVSMSIMNTHMALLGCVKVIIISKQLSGVLVSYHSCK